MITGQLLGRRTHAPRRGPARVSVGHAMAATGAATRRERPPLPLLANRPWVRGSQPRVAASPMSARPVGLPPRPRSPSAAAEPGPIRACSAPPPAARRPPPTRASPPRPARRPCAQGDQRCYGVRAARPLLAEDVKTCDSKNNWFGKLMPPDWYTIVFPKEGGAEGGPRRALVPESKLLLQPNRDGSQQPAAT